MPEGAKEHGCSLWPRSAAFQCAALVVSIAAPLLAGAGPSARTANFTVEAPSREVAERVAEHAEVCRTYIAKAWLGHELENWPRPCPIRVRLTDGEAGGITSFGFNQGRVTDQQMTVEGRLDRILASATPARGDAYDFRELFRRSDAALGR